ncbi:MAG: cyclic nucleotide-binding protein [Herbaspirillum sp.]|nr:cyclic nucleotide-binding protein [Herbaspirillum sp.]
MHTPAINESSLQQPSKFQAGLSKVLGGSLSAFIVALISLSYAVSYGAMIFGSGGSALLAAGIPLVLLSAFTMQFLVSWTSSVPFIVAGIDSNSAGVLALMAAGIAADLHNAGSTPQQATVTILMAVALSTIAAGIFMAALGALRRGSLVQFIPFPVVGGFLAGTGYLLLSGAFGIATGHHLSLAGLRELLNLPWQVWLPSILIAGVMLGSSLLKRAYPPLLPLTLIAATILFFTNLHLSGVSIQQARSMGWLFEPLTLHGFQFPAMLPWAEVRWGVIAAHYSDLLAMITVVTLTILLNSTGISLATRRDVDFNHELRSAGFANIISGALGGAVGSQSLSRSLLNFQSGSRDRISGVIAAFLCLLCACFFSNAVALIPKSLLVGLLTGLGCLLLKEWVWKARQRLATSDYLLILLILVVIAWSGFVTGVALGIVVACVLFVVDYGRVSCIKMEFTGASLTSRLERAIETGALLKAHGERVFGVCLQGYLFFGSANQMVNRVREQLSSQVEFVLIDFRRVQGMDASTSQSFIKLRQICEQHGITLIMTDIPDNARLPIERACELGGAVREFDTLDTALEWIENVLLAKSSPAHGAPDWQHGFREHFGDEHWQHLYSRLQTVNLDTGALLFQKGDTGDGMYFIEHGQVSISVPLDGNEKVRLRAFGSGTIVGEMSLYTGQQRTADVRTDSPTRVHKLSLQHLRELETDAPAVAMQLHNYVVTMLAGRLAATSEAYRLAF